MPVGSGIAHKCEACGLAVLSHGEKFFFPKRAGERQPGETGLKIEFSFDPGSTENVLAELELDRQADGSFEFENRDSLVCALAGRDLMLDCYREAIGRGYRFYSYGDCMLIL